MNLEVLPKRHSSSERKSDQNPANVVHKSNSFLWLKRTDFVTAQGHIFHPFSSLWTTCKSTLISPGQLPPGQMWQSSPCWPEMPCSACLVGQTQHTDPVPLQTHFGLTTTSPCSGRSHGAEDLLICTHSSWCHPFLAPTPSPFRMVSRSCCLHDYLHPPSK